jgi:hypothetical protein
MRCSIVFFKIMVRASVLLVEPLAVSFSLQTPLLVERQATTINVPATVPNTASDVVNHSYPSESSWLRGIAAVNTARLCTSD